MGIQLGFLFQRIIIIINNMKTILVFSALILLAMARPDVRQVNDAPCPPGTPIRCPVGSGSMTDVCVLAASDCEELSKHERQVNDAPCPPGTPIRCPVGSG